MNRVALVGRTTKDITLKKTPSGKSVATFSLAVSRRGSEESDFISCVAWNKTAELLERYVKKGNRIGISGRIQTRNYDDSAGRKIYVTEVMVDDMEFLENKRTEQGHDDNYERADDNEELYISDDDLPF